MKATEKSLLEFAGLWDKAMVQNDTEAIGNFMADDWVIVGTDGGIVPKTDFLSWVRSGDLIHTRMDSDEDRVKIYGNSGVVISKGTSSGTYKGEPFSFYEWSTSVFIYEHDSWKCVATMLTPAKG